MRSLHIFLVLILINVASVVADTPDDVSAMMRGLDHLTNLSNDQGELTHDQYIEKLGIGLTKTSHQRIYRIPEREETYKALQSTMISIPGHAEFYDKRIRKQWQGLLNARGTADEHRRHTRFLNETFYDFPVLRHMPSPETVRVLGEMIQSEEHIRSNVGLTPMASLAGQALVELHHLPLQSRPIAGRKLDPRRDLETYRLWYAQIKAGNRTFRFVGDPNEYTLAGPVRSSPEVASTPPKARDSATASPSTGTGPYSSTPWLAITLGGTLIGGALLYWFVSRRKA